MHITGELQLTWAIVRRIFIRETANRMLRVGGFIGLVSGGLLLVPRLNVITIAIVVSGALLFLLPELRIALIWRRTRTKTNGLAYYLITDRSIVVEAAGQRAEAGWDEVLSILIRRQDWLLAAPWAILGFIPRAAFSPADQARLDDFVRAGDFPRRVPPASSPSRPGATGTPGTVRDGRWQPGR